MFISTNKVRMHDTDMAGILYFPRQFRFVHDALEEFCEANGLSFAKIFHEEDFIFVIVHAETDYFSSLKVGDNIQVHLVVSNIGTTSFEITYKIYKDDMSLTGIAKTVHVTLDKKNRQKIPIPRHLKAILELQKQ